MVATPEQRAAVEAIAIIKGLPVASTAQLIISRTILLLVAGHTTLLSPLATGKALHLPAMAIQTAHRYHLPILLITLRKDSPNLANPTSRRILTSPLALRMELPMDKHLLSFLNLRSTGATRVRLSPLIRIVVDVAGIRVIELVLHATPTRLPSTNQLPCRSHTAIPILVPQHFLGRPRRITDLLAEVMVVAATLTLTEERIQ